MARRTVLLPALLFLVVMGVAAPAAADCLGPTVEPPTGTVEPGDTVTVRGIAFGDNCYDTGPPPEGEGVLGRPLDELEIRFVQGGEAWLVATGAADAEYEFEVDVTVPPGAGANPALFEVTRAGVLVVTTAGEPALTVAADGPGGDVEPVRFGPEPAAASQPAPEEPPEDRDELGADEPAGEPSRADSVLGWFVAACVAALVAVVVLRVLRRPTDPGER